MQDFRNVDWGPDEAKNDPNLPGYFVATPEFSEIEEGNIRYIIGRKGTGKTAIVEKIKQRVSKDAMGFHSNLSLRNFPVQEFRELRDKGFRDKAQFVSIWSFLIYIEIAKIISKDNGATSQDDADELRKFLLENGLNTESGFASTVNILRKSDAKVKVSTSWLDGEASKGTQSQFTTPVHYQKIVDKIEELIKNNESSSEYWLFIDELDEGFRAGDQNLRLLLLGLLRAVEDTSLSLKSANIKYRPLVALRSDIFDRLEDNDLNKLDDYIFRLHWTSREEKDTYALKLIADARIKNSIPALGNSPQAWEEIVDNLNVPSFTTSVWAFMASRTYDRPRDIIKFLKSCRKHSPSGVLSFDAVKMAEDTYSDWLYREIRDEIHSYLPCWRESLQCISRIGYGRFNGAELYKEFRSDRTIAKWLTEEQKEPEDLAETLFDFGVLGIYDGRWLFKYKDEDLAWNPTSELIVHFGLCKKLRVTRSRSSN
ncbi:P-loop ATPase, Sll1717 family [Herbaspirillum sp. YR522]|uniref:P-loop ATPase, Sll1717 family n=1 Tax=Herbaspirillum sp. YR522 TaxID=1144342 RepID=UPI00026FB37E|nr:hypothetical protein [Herbaspirillum sp. YR522]EJN06128.1 hypothetical protein PMI40_02306 [Herbaspirillum sp. YR522]